MANIVDVLNNRRIEEYIPELVYKSDGTYRGCCPIHGGDNETAFVVYPDNRYHCFACGSSGDLIHYKMEKDKIPFELAVQRLADDFGIDIDEKSKALIETCESKLQEAINYQKDLGLVEGYLLRDRKLSKETIERFKLGYNSKRRAVSIPMFDMYGRVVSFGYRYFEGSVKYRNEKNSELFTKGEYLYGINFAIERLKTRDTLYVCEGFFDTMSADEQELPCVAYCGITLNDHHVKLIRNICGRRDVEIVLVPDNDGKADKFVSRAREMFNRHFPKAVVKVMCIEDGYKDLNDLHKAGIKIESQSVISIEMFLVKQILNSKGSIELHKKKIIELIHTIKDALIKLDIAEYLSVAWGKPINTIKEFLSVDNESLDEIVDEFNTVNASARSMLSVMEEPILTGFPLVDESINMYKKQVTCVSAPSNTGKTDVLIEMLLHITIIQKKHVLFFSLEMSKEDVIEIILAKLLKMPRYRVRTYAENFPQSVTEILEKIGERLYIIDKVLSLKEIEERIKVANSRLFDERGTDVVAIDHFTLVKGNSSVEEQHTNGDKLIQIAKEHDVCLIVLSQLNKASQSVERGKIREPMLTDLMGSSSLGNACTTVLGLWRPEKTPSLSDIEKERWKNISRMKILKYRKLMKDRIYFQFKYDFETSRLIQLERETDEG